MSVCCPSLPTSRSISRFLKEDLQFTMLLRSVMDIIWEAWNQCCRLFNPVSRLQMGRVRQWHSMLVNQFLEGFLFKDALLPYFLLSESPPTGLLCPTAVMVNLWHVSQMTYHVILVDQHALFLLNFLRLQKPPENMVCSCMSSGTSRSCARRAVFSHGQPPRTF